MNILVIVGHPSAASLSRALADGACEALREDGHRVVFHDLCEEGFDALLRAEEIPESGPVPEAIQAHCEELMSADGIVIVHPNWWGQPPAVLKGWIDRVIRPGVAYRFQEGDSGEGVPVGLLKARTAVVLNTSNTPDGRERDVFGDPLELIWRKCIFGLCGVRDVRRRMFSVVVTSTRVQRLAWIEEAKALCREAFPKG